MVLTFLREGATEESLKQIEEIRQILGMGPDVMKYKVIYSPVNQKNGTLAVDTRSVLQILVSLGLLVDVPEADISDRRTLPGLPAAAPGEREMFRVHRGPDKPADAFTSVHYSNTWFWIDDTDLRAKRTFSFILFIFTLADTGSAENLPVLTIPTN